MEIIIQPSIHAAVELVARVLAREIQTNRRPVLGLATGRTMESVYSRLVNMHTEQRLDFSACRTFNLDEYVGLPGSDKHSYRHYMDTHLFKKVNIDLRNTYLPDGMATDFAAESQRYERLIHENGGVALQLLGIGHSGHIGFNEPPSESGSRTRVVTLSEVTIQQNAALFGGVEKMPRRAITMGVGTILESGRCLLLATGKEKAEIISKTIEGPVTGMIPASALQFHPRCTIVLDEAAGAMLCKAADYRRAHDNDPSWDWSRSIPAAGSDRSLKEGRLEPKP
jgi:glucosamine-6-phosphate deaminase